MYWNKKHTVGEKPEQRGDSGEKDSGAGNSGGSPFPDVDLSSLGVGVPGSVKDLEKLLKQYGPMLTKENRKLLEEAVTLLSQGGDGASLESLTEKFRSAYEKQKS